MADSIDAKLEAAAIRLGEAMARVTPKEREVLKAMKRQVDEFADNQAKEGKYYDRSMVFAYGIVAHQDLTDSTLIEAAKAYVDVDYEFYKQLNL